MISHKIFHGDKRNLKIINLALNFLSIVDAKENFAIFTNLLQTNLKVAKLIPSNNAVFNTKNNNNVPLMNFKHILLKFASFRHSKLSGINLSLRFKTHQVASFSKKIF